MAKRDKLIARLKAKPTDFTWAELVSVLEGFGYELKEAGGSGRKFIEPRTGVTVFLHEPHPGSILKAYQVRYILAHLRQEKHI